MKLLDKLEKKLGRFALPNVTIYLIAGQTLFYVLFLAGKLDRSQTWLSADLLLAGEWWRIFTFLFDPPLSNPLFAFFAWYLFYLMGSALEEQWGAFRYNVFLLIGCLMTVAVSFLTPAFPVSNAYIGGSVFLAFAFLYPDFILQIFFVLPVRIKWLAMVTWLYYGYLVLFGGWYNRLLVLASVSNFLLFFGRDIAWLAKSGKRQMARQARQVSRREDEPFHRCTVCGITDKSHPRMDFRYCPQCAGQRGYCQEHIFSHEHIPSSAPPRV
ncbi:MAG: rhomboid family intramembrane serine protease [Geobacteraceae bacterium]|nr:rhomboid family intramembrane serine protease [Geobacteraceae bacterium]